MAGNRPHIGGRRTLVAAVALSCAMLQVALSPNIAMADPLEELQKIQEQIQQSNAACEQADERVQKVQDEIDANEERIAELERELPEARDRAALSMRSLYKMHQRSGNLLDLVLAADDFYDLLTTVQYLDIIQEHNNAAVDELLAMEDELELARVSLSSKMKEAEATREEAETALSEANEARERLYAQIVAQAEAEAAARRAALEKAQQEQGESFATGSSNDAQVEAPVSGDPGTVDMGGEKGAFVSEWTQRIDAYLAGSPLAGQGKTFAEAAWEYGVDPRLSPAISTVESSTGRHCFLPHNAWGWGSSSWGSWEEAIWDHVEGLAIGYGGQLTYAGALKYCPPNADFWYASVLANMEQI